MTILAEQFKPHTGRRDSMRRILPFVLLSLLLAAGISCSRTDFETTEPGGFAQGEEANTCQPPDNFDNEALVRTGRTEGEEFAILPNGRRIWPAGKMIQLEMAFVWGMELSQDGTVAFATSARKHNGITLVAVNLQTDEVTPIPTDGKSSNGMVISPDGSTLYVAGGAEGKIYVIDISAAPTYQKSSEIDLCEGYIAGLAITPDGSKLLACDSIGSKLFIIDPANPPQDCTEVTPSVKVGYYPRNVLLSKDSKFAYVTNWAGNNVSVVDLEQQKEVARINTGRSPEAMALSADGKKLFVANADSSNISVIDLDTNEVSFTIELDPETPELRAMAPDALLLDPSNSRLYVACAQMNAVYVIDTNDPSYPVFAKIPTGAYPVELEMIEGSGQLVVANAHGWGSNPNPHQSTGSPENALPGAIEVIDLPTNDAELADLTHRVDENNNRPLTFYPDNSCENLIPGQAKNPIEHVVLVVKENKTYDEVFGDLKCNGEPRGDGDPNLTLFGEDITPNAHRLACMFTTFDNFYSDAEVSVQGHLWTTQADCNDYLNKLWFDQLALSGIEPATRSETGSIFDTLFEHGISFINYGEAVSFIPEAVGEYADHYDSKVSFYNMGVSDVKKALEVVRQIKNGIFPKFVYISLPNDHTFGGAAGKPHPECMVADNDYGLGILVDAITHSKYWESTIIFVIEDDPQSAAGDHIDAHRSIALAISPWVKHNYLSSVHYSNPSLYRTIEMLLGIPPMNRNTATAAPMYDIFTSEPDFTPYEHVKPDVEYRLNDPNTKAAKMSAKYDWSKIDGHEGLGDIIWSIMRPGQKRPDYAKVIDE